MKTGRLHYLDMAKGIGIILVVIGHSGKGSDGLITWLTSFHMPLFMIISGMLLCYKKEEEQSFLLNIKGKFFQIMVPYIIFSVIYLLIALCEIHRLKEGYLTNAVLQTVSFYGISVLWFLPALFMGETLFLFIRQKTSLLFTALCSMAVFTLSLLINQLWNGLETADSLFSLWLAYLITALIRSGIAVLFLAVGYFSMCLLLKQNLSRLQSLILSLAFFGVNYVISSINNKTDLRFLIFNNLLLYFTGAISGSIAVICLCKALPPLKLLSYFGKNSLIIMVTHLDCYIILLSLNFAHFINQYVTRAKEYIFCLNLALSLLVLETIIIYIINRYLPFLIGKSIKSCSQPKLFSKSPLSAKSSQKTTPAFKSHP